MKKLKIVAALLALATATGISGCSACNDDGVDPNPPVGNEVDNSIRIGVTAKEVTLKEYQVANWNFVQYFSITDDGKGVPARDYVDSSQVKAEAGEYTVTCTYKGKTASVTVKVENSQSELSLSRTELKIKMSEVEGYNFKALFTLTVDGKTQKITDDMVETDVKAEAGEYSYTVSFMGTSRTLAVTVIDENAIEIINSYSVLELTIEDLEDFDYTKLFSLYVGEVAEKVLLSYIDYSALAEPEEGRTYSVTMSFERNGRQASSTAQIKVVANTQISIISRNIETYPNSENIDLKSLFTIKNGNQIIEVTDDMISGTVDYSKEGDNLITLNYGGREATATVKIRLGVIINYAVADTVVIEKGTDINSYDFGSDFSVIINGIRFTNLTASYFVTDGVDFNKEGEYEVKIKVPYNTKPHGITSVDFDYFDKTITYKVVENKIEYSIDILNENVVLSAGTSRYNVYNNLSIIINGVKRIPMENKETSVMTCYVQTLSKPLDFTTTEEQVVEIAVYVYGPDEEPVIAAYSVRVDNGVVVTGREQVVFSGTTVYARELFTITENGKQVKVTDDMVSGKIDLFNPGIYFVTATYKGVTAQSKAVVLASDMVGTYKTRLTEIEEYEEDDTDIDDDAGWGDYDSYSLSAVYDMRASAATLKDFVIEENGTMRLGSESAEIVSIVDDSTFNIRLYGNEYLFSYSDGIITLDPDNYLRLAYTEKRRPMVYFNEDKWTAEDYLQVNSSINGNNVLQVDHAGNLVVSPGAYTIELTKLKSVESGEYYWYGMKTTYRNKISSDTYYDDEVFGLATLAPDFVQKEGRVSTVYFGGKSYEFTMSNGTKAIVNKNADTSSAFAGTVFNGTVDGKQATFSVSAVDKITLTVDRDKIFDMTVNDQSTFKNAGPDYTENTWLIYDRLNDNDHTPFSYRFRLDIENKTFTIDERDDLYGRYIYENVCFFFDGYGTGEVMFDTSSKYISTAFSYRKFGANIEITYLNPDPGFAYGKTAKFLLADYKNILTVREITGIDLVGAQFVNEIITDGAIVEVNNLVLGKGVAKTELFDGISIKTKDGKLTASQVEKYVDTSLIHFSIPGFYQLKINIPMDGGTKTAYYAVQILDNVYKDNPLVGRYAKSMVSSGASLILDEFGRVSGVFNGTNFNGTAYLTDGKFTATAKCSRGEFTISGELLESGIVKATARGALMFTDCFTAGTIRTCGTEDYVLREITAGSKTAYMLSNATVSIGNKVEVEGNVNTLGSILKITDGSKVHFVKVVEWGNTSSGLIVSDAVRGVYKKDGADDLVLDGFGRATLGAKSGEYAVYGMNVTVIFADEVKIYKIDTVTSTYTVNNVSIDAEYFAGKSLSAEYTFFCDNYSTQIPYTAVTVFEFKAGGKVIVRSASEEHDEDCDDKYAPEFATAEGLEGTFAVAGNKITVTVNGKTIEFTFTDAVGMNTVTCSSTDVSSSSHGYFATGREFTLV